MTRTRFVLAANDWFRMCARVRKENYGTWRLDEVRTM